MMERTIIEVPSIASCKEEAEYYTLLYDYMSNYELTDIALARLNELKKKYGTVQTDKRDSN